MADRSARPNLIIAGVNKAGTTSLFSYLTQHPDVCGSDVKETCYFLPLVFGETLPPVEEYERHFTGCRDEPVILEATPGYFYGGKALAQAINDTLDPVRILIILREPVARLVSAFRADQSQLLLPRDLSLDEYIEQYRAAPTAPLRRETIAMQRIQAGFYADYLPGWLDVFGDRLKLLFHDDLSADARGLLRAVCNWLEIDGAPIDHLALAVENRTINYRNRLVHWAGRWINRKGEIFWRANPQLKRLLRRVYATLNATGFDPPSAEALAALKTIYEPHNRRLRAQLLALSEPPDLPPWLAGL